MNNSKGGVTMDNGKRRQGTVKWFSAPSGYGFIVPDEPIEGLGPGKDLFVHFRKVIPAFEGAEQYLQEGDRVEFEVFDGRRGLEAAKAQVIR
jgi:cold shock CspA family protein